MNTGQILGQPGVEVSCLGDRKENQCRSGPDSGELGTLKLDFSIQAMRI